MVVRRRPSLHAFRRGHPHEIEDAREDDLGRRDELQPRLGEVFIIEEDAALFVEVVERGGEIGGVVGELERFVALGDLLQPFRQAEPLLEQRDLPPVGGGGGRPSSGLRCQVGLWSCSPALR